MKVLFLGDVVGKAGRKGLERTLPALRDRHSPDLVIANGENSAGGLGITEKTAAEIHAAGVDVITTGNHAYHHRDAYSLFDRNERVLRPANYLHSNPGQGHVVLEAGGMRVAVINLSGSLHLRVARSPFLEADALLERLARDAEAFIVDFHAELSSEKVAMGWHLDGRVAAVLGTHTHVPTADARVLPGGTAFISDVGMTGARDSVLGVKKEQVLEAFRSQMPVKFETSDRDVWLMGATIEIGEDGRARSIEQVLEPTR